MPSEKILNQKKQIVIKLAQTARRAPASSFIRASPSRGYQRPRRPRAGYSIP